MVLAGKSYPCLLDTGNSANLVPRDIAAQVPDLHVRPMKKKIWAANDTEILVDGEATVPFTMEGRQFNTECLISSDVEEIMLGIEWMKTRKCRGTSVAARFTLVVSQQLCGTSVGNRCVVVGMLTLMLLC